MTNETTAPVEQQLARWRDNLKITQGDPVCGDPLSGYALDFVIEQIDGILTRPEQLRPTEAAALAEVVALLSELLDGPSAGKFYGIDGPLWNKLETIRLATLRARMGEVKNKSSTPLDDTTKRL